MLRPRKKFMLVCLKASLKNLGGSIKQDQDLKKIIKTNVCSSTYIKLALITTIKQLRDTERWERTHYVTKVGEPYEELYYRSTDTRRLNL